MRFGRVLAGVALAATLAMGACSDSSSPNGTTQLSVRLKDAPGDVKAAVVTISQVYLQGEGKIVLRDSPVTVDLLTLAQTTAALVENATVPSGSYSELRFVISGAYVEVDNGDGTSSIYASSPTYSGLPAGATVAGTLQMPSLAQSGLKVDFGGAVSIEGAQKVVVVDFDVAQSFGHLAGQADKWILHPVIKGADLMLTGSVHATVQLGRDVTLPSVLVGGHSVTLADLSAQLTNTSDNSASTVALTDAGDGVFAADFQHVLPGTYTLQLVVPAGLTTVTTAPAAPLTLTVTSGQQASAAFTVTALQ